MCSHGAFRVAPALHLSTSMRIRHSQGANGRPYVSAAALTTGAPA